MRQVKIPKRSGGSRLIYVPDENEKGKLRQMVGYLTAKAAEVAPDAHAFVHGRSPVTNAKVHAGKVFSLCVDLKDFFDSVKPEQVRKKISDKDLSRACGLGEEDIKAKKSCFQDLFVDGAPRQGLPTSPAVANIAAVGMDDMIKRFLGKVEGVDGTFAYSRYADDITVSYTPQLGTDVKTLHAAVKNVVYDAIRKSGFKPNPTKTQLQWAGAGRRSICGVNVDMDGTLHPTRRARRHLRAAEHQGKKNQVRGLSEWCKLKEPRKRLEIKEPPGFSRFVQDALALVKGWKLNLPRECITPELAVVYGTGKTQIDLAPNAIQTRDPAYMLGLSNFGEFSSCMRHPCKRLHGGLLPCKGAPRWFLLAGTSVAVLLGDKIFSYFGVRRRETLARCLVHRVAKDYAQGSAENGSRLEVYDRIYGKSDQYREKLKEAMEAHGIVKANSDVSHRGRKVLGYVPTDCGEQLPYLDNTVSYRHSRRGWSVKLSGERKD